MNLETYLKGDLQDFLERSGQGLTEVARVAAESSGKLATDIQRVMERILSGKRLDPCPDIELARTLGFAGWGLRDAICRFNERYPVSEERWREIMRAPKDWQPGDMDPATAQESHG